MALVLLFDWVLKNSKGIFRLKFIPVFLGTLLLLKFGLQLISAHPYFAKLSATILDFTIGYLHLTFLGVITIGILVLSKALGYLKISKIPFLIYTIGFLSIEFLIFQQGIAAWLGSFKWPNHTEFLVLASGVLVISLILIFWTNLKKVI